jgi:hypothetical protein
MRHRLTTAALRVVSSLTVLVLPSDALLGSAATHWPRADASREPAIGTGRRRAVADRPEESRECAVQRTAGNYDAERQQPEVVGVQ